MDGDNYIGMLAHLLCNEILTSRLNTLVIGMKYVKRYEHNLF